MYPKCISNVPYLYTISVAHLQKNVANLPCYSGVHQNMYPIVAHVWHSMLIPPVLKIIPPVIKGDWQIDGEREGI